LLLNNEFTIFKHG